MQLVGIYLFRANEYVGKNLKPGWYPFGDFEKCPVHENYNDLVNKIKEKQEFTNRFYNIDQKNGTKKGPTINLNCIVGKNGSGKSTVLAILYRIINNLACKLKEIFPKYNLDYEPVWAWGFEAELYYEINGKIAYIKVGDNYEFHPDENRDPEYPVELMYDGHNILENPKSENEEREKLKTLQDCLFYTIGTNYSLYTNSAVRFKYDEKTEEWLSTIYHKNDGYFTPIVLVPYRDDSIIDTDKELKLANERVNTLAILLKASENSDFIEDFIPEKVVYKLKENYEDEINKKLDKALSNDKDEIEDLSVLREALLKSRDKDGLYTFIKKQWESKLENKKLADKSSDIFKNIILYLSYKTIKVCLYYDRYKNQFLDDSGIFNCYEDNPVKCKDKIKEIINGLESSEKLDFINLKIRQCINFSENGSLYVDKIDLKKDNAITLDIETRNKIEDKEDVSITVDEIINLIKNDLKLELNYDNVFINLPPPIFYKEYRYKEKDSKNSESTRTISSMSSGEQQVLYSLSYAVYHMKNAASNQNAKKLSSIPYRNMNLIFDEAELYYHPEYQRKFIDNLLGILKRSHFEETVDSINITIVTHSPFMLSDIPSKNILALEKGKVTRLEDKTLGANIYDLLAHQFFMDSAIGAHIEKEINKILDDFKDFEEDKYKDCIKPEYKENLEYYEMITDKIGDEYLRSTLKNMIDEMSGKFFIDRRIADYKEKIKRLEKENEKN